jgi:hypothetical protein
VGPLHSFPISESFTLIPVDYYQTSMSQKVTVIKQQGHEAVDFICISPWQSG